MSDNKSDSGFFSLILIIILIFLIGVIINFMVGPLKFLFAFVMGLISALWFF